VKTISPAAIGAATLILMAVAASARSQDSDWTASEPAPMESVQGTLESNAPESQPLFNLGGVGVHVWAPVESPYDSHANTNLAHVWGAGTEPSQSGY
jgi:hypothetical protein